MGFPEGFATRIQDVHGEVGKAWLERLPDLIQYIEQAWSIHLSNPFPGLNYNYVAPAVLSNNLPAVLKLSVPGEHLVNEATALEAYGGHGAPKLLKQDLKRGALLMERVSPGEGVIGQLDAQAVNAMIGVMEQLHQASIPQKELPTVIQWGAGFHRLRKMFGGGTGPLPASLVQEAEDVFRNLVSSMGPAVLLHGDLHHMNILSAGERSWLAIDPKGVIGERAYEIGAFLRNPMPNLLEWPDLEVRQRQRIIEFSKRTGIQEKRISGWGFSQAVLSAIWSIEDHGRGWEISIRVAKGLRNLAFT